MIKKILFLGVASLLFLSKPTQPVLATTTTNEEVTSSEIETSSSEEVVSSEGGSSLETIANEPLAQIENIIVALFVSFTGTGTVALVVKTALSKVTKQMTKKVQDAETLNKKSIQQIIDLENTLKNQVGDLDKTVKDLIINQTNTNENIKMMLEEYKQRDEQIKDLITKELSDEGNE
jgi:beta-lactamase regulating signal transducer with metallopeptidase domain